MRKSGMRLAGRFQALLIQRTNNQARHQRSFATRRRWQIDPKRRSENRAQNTKRLVRLVRTTQ
jgi:hypothetical protein